MKPHLSVLESGVDEPLLVTVLDAPTSRVKRERSAQDSALEVTLFASGPEAKEGTRTNELTVMFLDDVVAPERARVLLSSVMQPLLNVAQPVGRVTFETSDGFCQTVSRFDPPQFSVASPELGRHVEVSAGHGEVTRKRVRTHQVIEHCSNGTVVLDTPLRKTLSHCRSRHGQLTGRERTRRWVQRT